ncbi:hypothetical protein OEA41_007668 [Lepraria neglecta]|uniref:Uncharacterized protein n=1 Tax=Lepraria neglecta TaxID=209136 RepID=A0AAD9ZDZ6_9LECA|nr:hypothetical protein OEA41_007668 [Lepraria neglecta]
MFERSCRFLCSSSPDLVRRSSPAEHYQAELERELVVKPSSSIEIDLAFRPDGLRRITAYMDYPSASFFRPNSAEQRSVCQDASLNFLWLTGKSCNPTTFSQIQRGHQRGVSGSAPLKELREYVRLEKGLDRGLEKQEYEPSFWTWAHGFLKEDPAAVLGREDSVAGTIRDKIHNRIRIINLGAEQSATRAKLNRQLDVSRYGIVDFTFQKQTAVDRTLQQDRLAAHQAQAESFRSAPGPNAGILDAEFEAFQAGYGLEAGYPDPQYFSNGPQAQLFQSNASQPQLPNWASDFQNLHLNEAQASPTRQFQFRQHAPLQRTAPGGWHQDFMRQQGQSSPYQPQQQQRPASGWAYGYTGGLMPQNNTTLSPIAQQKQPERHVEADLDEAAFERAFEAATSEIQQSEKQGLQQDTKLSQDMYGGLSPETEWWLDHNRIGSDRILDEAQEEEKDQNEHDEADELARTAGQLLENVKGDHSQKFQESNFLSLMRQLRDKEVRVEGDKLVDVSIPSSSS